jgi:acetyltransferase-like isoleucine patch superfamily enzyme
MGRFGSIDYQRLKDANIPSRILMIRWHIRGVKAALSACVCARVSITNPRRLTMARRSHIGPGSYIKCVPGTIHLGECASLSEGCWISSTESVRIDAYALIGPGCQITDANHGINGRDVIRKQPRIASPVIIGEAAWLGAGAKILSGVTVGRGAVVGAGAVVTRDVPDYAIVGGVPARIIGHREAEG